mgnify:CR=1 FL=1
MCMPTLFEIIVSGSLLMILLALSSIHDKLSEISRILKEIENEIKNCKNRQLFP